MVLGMIAPFEPCDIPEEAAFLEKAYSDCPKISIDYGVMEKTDRSWLYPGNFGWGDMDTWEAIQEHCGRKDKDGNCFLADKVMADSDSGTLLMSTLRGKKKLYAIKGLKDFIVISLGTGVGSGIYINGQLADSYTFRLNYYWMMGDNRDNSADSRFWGFVPEDHVVGKPLFVWISLDPDYGLFSGGIRWNRLFTFVDNIK